MQMILRRDVGTDLNLAKLKTIPKLCKKMSMPQERTWIYAMLVALVIILEPLIGPCALQCQIVAKRKHWAWLNQPMLHFDRYE
jgi:hypothetical protein